jgi:hypothetical protein
MRTLVLLQPLITRLAFPRPGATSRYRSAFIVDDYARLLPPLMLHRISSFLQIYFIFIFSC